ncbi:DNA-directed RNA polymerase subunit delta [Mycoplasmopsis lipofaciens]|uniref:DNA-directed RNA polymerase subunit delta n=1 Tax=Mycoplasmopsis lipofaciens TaxID=114884 RepID=UPI000485A7FB|nr:hypothetical protein [Mycoplasmopsis lipofaciens]
MKTMLDIVVEYTLKECSNNYYVEFDKIFNEVETELKNKWMEEADLKGKSYDKIRINKIGELYRLLTVDSRFIRNEEGLWSTRTGLK